MVFSLCRSEGQEAFEKLSKRQPFKELWSIDKANPTVQISNKLRRKIKNR